MPGFDEMKNKSASLFASLISVAAQYQIGRAIQTKKPVLLGPAYIVW